MAAVRVIALGRKTFAASTLNVRFAGCASGFGVGLRAGVARGCKAGALPAEREREWRVSMRWLIDGDGVMRYRS